MRAGRKCQTRCTNSNDWKTCQSRVKREQDTFVVNFNRLKDTMTTHPSPLLWRLYWLMQWSSIVSKHIHVCGIHCVSCYFTWTCGPCVCQTTCKWCLLLIWWILQNGVKSAPRQLESMRRGCQSDPKSPCLLQHHVQAPQYTCTVHGYIVILGFESVISI